MCASNKKKKDLYQPIIKISKSSIELSRLLIMSPQCREISHKKMFPPDVISSHFDAGMLISRFLGRSCEKRPPPPLGRIESTSGPVNDIIRRRDENSTRGQSAHTCAHVYRFKKRSHHPLFLSTTRISEESIFPPPFLDAGRAIHRRPRLSSSVSLPFRFGSRLAARHAAENWEWNLILRRDAVHGMAKMQEMDQDALSLSPWSFPFDVRDWDFGCFLSLDNLLILFSSYFFLLFLK